MFLTLCGFNLEIIMTENSNNILNPEIINNPDQIGSTILNPEVINNPDLTEENSSSDNAEKS
jgi:hypothetical protein